MRCMLSSIFLKCTKIIYILLYILLFKIDAITEKSYTLQQMYDLSKKASCALRKQGLRKGDVIAIISPNCLDYPIIELGAMAIGAIITAFNPLSTPKEISYLLSDSEAKIVILHPFVIKSFEAAESKNVEKKFVFGSAEGYTSISSFYE